jgi:hypothetical protein
MFFQFLIEMMFLFRIKRGSIALVERVQKDT